MKKIIFLIINLFGLMLMLISGFNLIKNIPLVSSMDSVYATGYLVGSLIPFVIGYMLFRLKVKNNSELKQFSDNELHSKRYELPLVEYVKLFDTFKSQRNLNEAGLWWHKVHVMQIPKRFEEIVDKNDSYYIGWEYPSSASLYDMSMELPVMFKKLDGSTLSLGIELKYLELIVNNN